ncbi:MAG: anaerobic sulfatase maturase [Lautropia sp.]|nr:anaerobic sulfatase maturase [Lautropia sp.]
MSTRWAEPRLRPVLGLPPLAAGDHYAFHTMVKPSGSQCNIACDYCFYLHKAELLDQPGQPRMPDAVLAEHIRQYIEAQTGPEVVFTWQGGEPTLMGLDFFRRVVAHQRCHARPGQRILNDLQTNGLLLDDEWCRFLKAHGFLVGISIDGPADLHDSLRKARNGKPTFARVMKAIERLRAHGIPFNALCVVNRINAQAPMRVYEFLRDEVRPRMIQFLAAVEPLDFRQTAPGFWPVAPDHADEAGEDPRRPAMQVDPVTGKRRLMLRQETGRPAPQAEVTDWTVAPAQWGEFLSTVWQTWLLRDFGRVFIDQFENTLSQALGHGAQKCTTAPICGKALAVEHNGDLYACDHFVYPAYRLGNILDVHQGDLAFSERQRAFGYAKHKTLPDFCRRCAFLTLCWGECPKNRFLDTPEGEPGLNYLCQGLKRFYRQVVDDLPQVKARLQLVSRRVS